MVGAAVAVLVIDLVEDVLVELVLEVAGVLDVELEVLEVAGGLDVELEVTEIEETDLVEFEDPVPEAVIVT